ncbi:hypothetical protein RHMOL_Rhmol13G0243900 [Rhododendron molle]|uniref:Uncharacterized protein n=1 Tax=Rhododendron molle TaxID=49168 RepID=A0ACC0LAR6_RHOML|nr:hypothetical protein RHMOL_Rhmol13G0243900 [Rhododendron molle]
MWILITKWKAYSAAVGDITILAKRWKLDVAFTVPFTESGLTLVVSSEARFKGGDISQAFHYGDVVGYSGCFGLYNVHSLVPRTSVQERRILRPIEQSTWKCSLVHLAHRERIQSNHARIVVVVWLFLALVLMQSYTANLTSMLTVSRLRPKIWSPDKVGCDENAFKEKYIREELNFTNVTITIKDEDEYLARFKNGNISAAFLDNPYAKAFVNRYCRDFTLLPTTLSFGGFGFGLDLGLGTPCSLFAPVNLCIFFED